MGESMQGKPFHKLVLAGVAAMLLGSAIERMLVEPPEYWRRRTPALWR